MKQFVFCTTNNYFYIFIYVLYKNTFCTKFSITTRNFPSISFFKARVQFTRTKVPHIFLYLFLYFNDEIEWWGEKTFMIYWFVSIRCNLFRIETLPFTYCIYSEGHSFKGISKSFKVYWMRTNINSDTIDRFVLINW